MTVGNVRVDGIEPELNMLAVQQRLIFGSVSPVPLNQLSIDNLFTPTSLAAAETLFELRNNNSFSGIRLRHITAFGETVGSLKIQSFTGGSLSGTDLLVFNNDGTLTFPVLATGILKNPGTGILSTAIPGTDYYSPGYPTNIIASFTPNANPLLAVGNLGIGIETLNALTLNSGTNTYNLGLGSQALRVFTTGAANIAIGDKALISLTAGSYNTVIGARALGLLTSASPGSNSIFGALAGLNLTTSDSNCIYGFSAISFATSLSSSCFFGVNTSTSNGVTNASGFGTGATIAANYGTAIGSGTYTDTAYGTVVGYQATTSLANNATAIGALTNVNGNNGIALGYDADAIGANSISIGASSNANDTGGTDGIAIGTNTSVRGTNTTAIGQNLTVTQDNAFILGNNQNVGIGTLTPAYKLDVAGIINTNNQMRFTNSTHYIGFQAGTLSVNTIWTLPVADSTGTQALVSNGSGTMSWSSFASLSTRLDQFAAPTSNLNLNSQKIINLATPTLSTDGVNRAYADAITTSFAAPKYIIQTSNASVPNAQILASLTTGLLKNTTTTGVLSTAVAGTDYYSPSNPTKLIDDTNNTSMGLNALSALTTGSGNSIFGRNAAQSLTTATNNCIFYSGTTMPLTTGSSNSIFGTSAGQSLTTGGAHVLMGNNAGQDLTIDSSNTFVGSGSGIKVQSGTVGVGQNVGLGWGAGTWAGAGFATYDHCTFLGYNTSSSVANLTNASAIGSNAVVSASNSMVLGSGVNIGMGESSPTYAKLCLVGGVQNLTNEETCLRAVGSSTSITSVKIEIRNIAAGGKLYEMRSSSTGSWDLTDRTSSVTRLVVTTSGLFGVGWGASTPTQLCDVNGNFRAKKIMCQTGTTPSVIAGAGAGTGAGLSVSGSESSGTFALTAGTSPIGNSLGTFTLASGMVNSSYGVLFTPANQATAALAPGVWTSVTSNTQFTVNCATALVASTAYVWNYTIIGC